MLPWLSCVYVVVFQLELGYAAFGRQTFMTSFQTNIQRHTSATVNVWIELTNEIPRSKELTVCHLTGLDLSFPTIAAVTKGLRIPEIEPRPLEKP